MWQTFLCGAASVLNLSGSSPQPKYLNISDEDAIRGDFEQVGSLIVEAMEQVEIPVMLDPTEPFLPGLLD
jgi:hypothetical protein